MNFCASSRLLMIQKFSASRHALLHRRERASGRRPTRQMPPPCPSPGWPVRPSSSSCRALRGGHFLSGEDRHGPHCHRRERRYTTTHKHSPRDTRNVTDDFAKRLRVSSAHPARQIPKDLQLGTAASTKSCPSHRPWTREAFTRVRNSASDIFAASHGRRSGPDRRTGSGRSSRPDRPRRRPGGAGRAAARPGAGLAVRLETEGRPTPASLAARPRPSQ